MSDAFILGKALESHFKGERLADAMDAIVEAYFEEYTDADELDGNFRSALETVFNVCFPSGETDDGREFEEIEKKPPRT